jgi:hypothetical protein
MEVAPWKHSLGDHSKDGTVPWKLLRGTWTIRSRLTWRRKEASQASISDSLLAPEESTYASGGPEEGHWNWEQPLNSRYCFDHGEEEKLFPASARWIASHEFKASDPEAKLRRWLLQHRSQPRDMDPNKRSNQAECDASPWKRILAPMASKQDEDKLFFLIQPRPTWTPLSEIKDSAYAKLAEAEIAKGRHSSRLKESAPGRLEKLKEITKVVKLEEMLNV